MNTDPRETDQQGKPPSDPTNTGKLPGTKDPNDLTDEASKPGKDYGTHNTGPK